MDKGPKRRLRRFPAPRRTREGSTSPAASGPSWGEPGELPELHDQTRVVLMAVSPYLVHAYWDLDSKTQANGPGACLRFHDTTAGQPPSSFDIPVDLATKSWYVHLWGPSRRYTVELGWNRADGFVSLARSNQVETPRAWPVAEVQERFARVGETPAKPEPVPVAETMPVVKPASRPMTPPMATERSAMPPATVPPATVPSMPPAAPIPQTNRAAEPPPQVAGPAGPPTQAVPSPVNSAEALRSRLMELYANRWWRGRPGGVPAGTEPESLLAERSLGMSDSTGEAESRFTPGFSSSLLGLAKPKEPAG